MAFIGWKKKKNEGSKEVETRSVLRRRKRKKRKRRPNIPNCFLEHIDDIWNDFLEFPEEGSLDYMVLSITLDEGIWKGFTYRFHLRFTPRFPIQPPKITITPRIWHPNIDDPEGHVCLLRDSWNPTMNINTIFWGLKMLMLEPNPDDPVNIQAADDFEDDFPKFKRKAENWMRMYGECKNNWKVMRRILLEKDKTQSKEDDEERVKFVTHDFYETVEKIQKNIWSEVFDDLFSIVFVRDDSETKFTFSKILL